MIKFIKSLFKRKERAAAIVFMNAERPEFLKNLKSGDAVEIELTDEERDIFLDSLEKNNSEHFEKILAEILRKKIEER